MGERTVMARPAAIETGGELFLRTVRFGEEQGIDQAEFIFGTFLALMRGAYAKCTCGKPDCTIENAVDRYYDLLDKANEMAAKEAGEAERIRPRKGLPPGSRRDPRSVRPIRRRWR